MTIENVFNGVWIVKEKTVKTIKNDFNDFNDFKRWTVINDVKVVENVEIYVVSCVLSV